MSERTSDRDEPTSSVRPYGGAPKGSEQGALSRFISRLAEGEDGAWREMWARYGSTSLGLIRHLIAARNWFALKGWEEDVLVESFVRLLRGVEKFRGTTYQELDRFVRANLVFTCLQKLRELGRWPEGPVLYRLAGPETAAGEDQFAVADCEHILRAAIAALPPELAKIVDMNLAGYDSQETAQRIGVSRQAVFDRKHRALSMLRDQLKKDQFWEQCASYISQLRLARGGGSG